MKDIVTDIKGMNLIDRFNKFFGGSAEIRINGDCLEITINHATLIISLAEVVGGKSTP